MSNIGNDLIQGMENAVAHARGRKRAARETVVAVAVAVPDRVDVARIRHKLSMSQAVFAMRYGFSVKNIRNWEQGVHRPNAPARAYLIVIDRDPKAVETALRATV